MCGIIGVLGRLPDKEVFLRARDLMEHRGPDDAGLYFSRDDEIALGQRRLSIIDLSELGRQPFVSNDKRFLIVFNGEIYNYLEIREELKDLYNFKTETDTEVLLASFIVWGKNCLEKFNGMFAFAIWDSKEKELFVARDRMGIKPFYYVQKDGNFYFASEIKSLLELGVVERKVNKRGLADYLNYRYVLGKETLYHDVFTLLPGHFAFVEIGREINQTTYWQLPVNVEKSDPGEEVALAQTTKLLKEAVALRMRSDVPVGAYLSGGLDSSILVAMMSKLHPEPIKTFSMGFAEEGFNELPFAELVSQKYHTEHRAFTFSSREYQETLREVIKFKDAPLLTPNEVPWYILSAKLKDDITVVLSGGGADELFGGYGRIFRSAFDYERLQNLSAYSKEEKDALLNNLVEKYGRIDFSSPLDHFLNQYPYFKNDNSENLLNKNYFNGQSDFLNTEYFKTIFSKINKLNVADQYLYIFQSTHLLGTLQHLDNVTMSVSVEGRVPYVDHKLVEYVWSLPFKYKLAWKSRQAEDQARLLNSSQISEQYDITKYLLRQIGKKYLPAEITERKKVGFPVPIDNWLQTDFLDFAKDILLAKEAKLREIINYQVLEEKLVNKKCDGRLVWALVNLEIWLQDNKMNF